MNPGEDPVEMDDELSEIRRGRQEMQFKEEWIENGHGAYSTLTSTTEEEFFTIANKSERVVVHCCRSSTIGCAIVDNHLDILARKHIETKFCKLDVDEAPDLCTRLGIDVYPTILLFKGGRKFDFIVGFDDFGGYDDFSTKMLEWRIAQEGLINYDGDLMSPPEPGAASRPQRSVFTHVKKNVSDDAEGGNAPQGDR